MTTYTAWDDKEYPWPPPDGWYVAGDGKWWPEGYGPGATPTADPHTIVEPAPAPAPAPLAAPAPDPIAAPAPAPLAAAAPAPVAAPSGEYGATPPPGTAHGAPPAASSGSSGGSPGKILALLGGLLFLVVAGIGGFFALRGGADEDPAAATTTIPVATAGGDETTTTAPPATTTSTAPPVDDTVAETTPSGDVQGTFENPYEAGDRVSVFYDDFDSGEERRWVIEVMGPVADITQAVLDENQFNDEPPAGSVFAAVPVRVTYESGPAPADVFDLNFFAIGPSGVVLKPFDQTCGVTPNELAAFAELFPGGSVEGNVCWATPSGDLTSLKMIVEVIFVDGQIYIDLN